MPVRSDAELRDLVHRERSYLHFERRARVAYDRRMDRLVLVLLGHRDIVLEPAGNVLVDLVDDTQDLIALRYFVNDYPACVEIVDLVYCLALVVHLLIDAVVVLGPAVYLRRLVIKNL